jgi:hypothetical protein
MDDDRYTAKDVLIDKKMNVNAYTIHIYKIRKNILIVARLVKKK